MYLLDTDHISIIQRGGQLGERIALRLNTCRVPHATTVVTYEEQMRGWLDRIAKAKTIDAKVAAYQLLRQHIDNYRKIAIVEFDYVSAQTDQYLRKAHPRLGAMDLKIAAIAITHNATLLTRNQSDFGQITELRTEDWSI